MIQKCKQCGKMFELSDSEIAFFNRKGLDLPKRCESCRRQNRKAHQNDEPTMPGIQQVREVDPGFRRSAPSYEQKTGNWKRQNEEIPFWKQQEKQARKKNPVLAAVIVIVLVLAGTAAGTMYAVKQAGITARESRVHDYASERVAAQPTYYLNTYRKKFHKPDCDSVQQMDPENRKAFYRTREEAIEMGYSPCNNCKP